MQSVAHANSDKELFGRLRVLIAGATPAAAKKLRHTLKGLGVKDVIMARDSGVAQAELKAARFDIVFCDSAIQPLGAVAFSLTLRKDPALGHQRTPVVLTAQTAQKRSSGRAGVLHDTASVPLSTTQARQALLSILAGPRPLGMAKQFSDADRRHAIERRTDADGRHPLSTQERRKPRTRRRDDSVFCD